MDEIHEVTGMKLAELRDVMTERKQWRRLAMMVTSFPGTDSTRSTVPCSLSTVNMGIHSKIPTAFILSTLLLSVLLSANCTYTSCQLYS